jgi:hypothetical protein
MNIQLQVFEKTSTFLFYHLHALPVPPSKQIKVLPLFSGLSLLFCFYLFLMAFGWLRHIARALIEVFTRSVALNSQTVLRFRVRVGGCGT